MDQASAQEFVGAWVSAWNARELEAVLAHFSDDVVFTSPLAAQIVPQSKGVIRGKAALREYWSEGLRRNPELHFELLGLYLGVDTIVINYRNERGGLVAEVLRFEGAHAVEGYATYLEDYDDDRR